MLLLPLPDDLKQKPIGDECSDIVMGVVTASDEYTSPVPAARLFQALVVDYPNLIPKLVPQVIMTVDVYLPEGGVGSIRHIVFAEGCEPGYVKNRVEELNEETLTYKCTTIEGGPLTEGRIETFVYEAKIEAVAEGGSVSRMTSTYYTTGDTELSEDEIRIGSEKTLGMYKLVEAYLLQNPEAYA